MSAPVIIEDIRPFLAFLVPLVAVIGIVRAGEDRRNLRETFGVPSGNLRYITPRGILGKPSGNPRGTFGI